MPLIQGWNKGDLACDSSAANASDAASAQAVTNIARVMLQMQLVDPAHNPQILFANKKSFQVVAAWWAGWTSSIGVGSSGGEASDGSWVFAGGSGLRSG